MVDALREEPDVMEVDGTSAAGVSLIFVEVDYKAPPAKLKQIMSELRDIVDRVTLTFPPGTSPPRLRRRNLDGICQDYFDNRQKTDGPSPLRNCGASHCYSRTRRSVPQTRRVKLYGLPGEEVRVALDETRLAMLGISIDEVAAALSRADARTPAGQLTGAGAALTVELTGEFTDLESVREVIVGACPTAAPSALPTSAK